MAGANSNIQVTGLDFDEIKANFKTYLNSQEVLKDANYEGSVLSILLDVLAYNTHYNSHYLNMVANEMFLDTAVKRASTISHAKVLGYLPHSFSAPTAVVDLVFSGVTSDKIIIPKYTKFLTDSVDNVNYTYVTLEEYVIETDKSTNTATLLDLEIKQGEPLAYSFVFRDKAGPANQKFKIPDSNVDLSTLKIIVQNSNIDIRTNVYNYPKDMLALNGESEVYFVQESFEGFYEIYFGDGILGKKLVDGNIIYVTYLTVNSTIIHNISNFYLMSPSIGDYGNVSVNTVTPSMSGRYKESINSIKNIAPKAYQAQERAVTVNDYTALIQKYSGELPIDAVNVWSGEENSPPVYGRIFVSVKPRGGFTLTKNQKNRITEDLIKPMSVITVQPVVVDVDYSYLNVYTDVLYDKNKTTLTAEQLRTSIVSSVKNYGDEYLNTFNATVVLSDLIKTVNDTNPSIITNDCNFQLEKKILPTLKTAETYTFDFGMSIKRDLFRNSVRITPSIKVIDINTNERILRNEVFIEEVPTSATSVQAIEITNPGFGYTSVPKVTISGDGSGAIATAIIVDGRVQSIVLENAGNNYTQAIAEISGGGGSFAAARVKLQNQFGLLRSFYYSNGVKTILSSNAGYVDYINGIVVLENFNPYDVNNNVGELSVYVVPDTSIIYSKQNKMIVLDRFDVNSVKVNLKTK